jgi:hypothetical protein
MCMPKVFPNNSIDVVYTCMPFIQKWRILAGKTTRYMMDGLQEIVLTKAKAFRLSKCRLSDVEFL